MHNRIVEEDVKKIVQQISHIAGKLSGKTVLITGGAGFLGNYLILTLDYLNRHILEKPCRIISIDNFITGINYLMAEGPTFKPIKHDMRFPIKIDEPVHFIIHAAGIASPKFYRIHKIETLDVGMLGTKHMLELAKEKNVESFMFFSSSEVYGDPEPHMVPTAETYNGNVSCTGPRSNYDESKRIGEALCVAYHDVHNIPVKMVRPFNVYGPGMREDDERVIPNFVSNAFKGEPVMVYGHGNQSRTFCYITDATVGFFKVLLSNENREAFNVGFDQQEISMIELAQIFSDIMNGQVKMKRGMSSNDAYGSADPKRRCPDLDKIRTKLGYNPTVSLDEGMQRFVVWASKEYSLKNKELLPLLADLETKTFSK